MTSTSGGSLFGESLRNATGWKENDFDTPGS